jgi:hypothetical protein
MNKNYTIADLIQENKNWVEKYSKLVKKYEDKGIENMNIKQLNKYETYLGNLELRKKIAERLEKINLVK